MNVGGGEVQVGGHGSIGNKAAFVIGVIALIVAVIFWVEDQDAAMAAVFGVPGGTALIASFVIGLRRRSRRSWIADTGSGFVYRDRSGQSEISDDQVVGINLIEQPIYRQGELKSYARKINLKVVGRSDIDLKQVAKIGTVDPLSHFLDRTIAGYSARATEALDSGARLQGANWSVGRDDIEIDTKGSGARRIPVSELAAVETIDDEYHVWDLNNEKAILRVPIKSENAFLLGLMLAPKIDQQNENREFDLSTPGLGRQIFARSTGRIGRIFAWLCLVVAAVSVPVFIYAVAANVPDAVGIAIGAVFLSPVALALGIYLLRVEFRCHERGVFKQGMIGSRQLRFEDVDQFTYSATRQYYNGVYAGTAMSLKFMPLPGRNARKFVYSRSVQNADAALDRLRDHISRVLMVRMAAELRDTGQTQWTPNLRISNDGLHFRPRGFVKRKEEKLIPFGQVAAVDIQEGVFHVWEVDTKNSTVQESAGEPNFFPGYLLLMALFSQEE